MKLFWEEENKENIEELARQIDNHNIVPFIGAGMSAGIYPMWGEYLAELPDEGDEETKDELSRIMDEKKPDYEKAAQFLCGRLGIGFYEKTEKIFSNSKIRREKINEALFKIPQFFHGPVITTNLDQMIEYVYRYKGIHLPVGLAKDIGFINKCMVSGQPCLWKIHGDIDKRDTWVLTKEKYDEIYGEDGEQFQKLFQVFLQYKSLLFLGASLKGDKVVGFLEKLWKENCNIRHYAVMGAPQEKGEFYQEKNRLQKLGIIPIWYPAGDYKKCTELIQSLPCRSSEFWFPSYIPGKYRGSRGGGGYRKERA